MNQSPHTNSHWEARVGIYLWVVVAVFQLPTGAVAQQAILNTLAAQAVASTQKIDLESMPYTIKSGDFRLLITPSFGVDWNDNINLSNTSPQQAFILKPLVQLDASYPITQVNLLRLNVGVGYDEYLEHSQYSNWRVQSGSQLSFDTYVKDVLINLHDRFTYLQDPGNEALDPGTGDYGYANNVVGIAVKWDPRNLDLAIGYDHQNIVPTGTAIETQDGSTEIFSGRAGWKFAPTTVAGIEATYSTTAYNQAVLNNNSSYTIGAYGQWHPSEYFSIIPRAGFSIFQFQQTSTSGETVSNSAGNPVGVLTGQPLQTSDFDAWYADLTLVHDITRALSYSLSVGHQIQVGFQSDAVEDSYVRLGSTWKIIKDLDLHASFLYEHGQEGIGNVAGNLTETYDWYSGMIDVNRQLTTRLSVGLNSRFTVRSSNSSSFAYTQALVGVHMAYVFE